MVEYNISSYSLNASMEAVSPRHGTMYPESGEGLKGDSSPNSSSYLNAVLSDTSTANYNNTTDFDLQAFLEQEIGGKPDEIKLAILTVIYCVIFATGIVGNVCTCIVIARNHSMHTATNYYLFSLAVSDLMTIVIGLPPDLYSSWKPFPWPFGEPFCIFKVYVSEMTSYASILTITAFTIERYVAICHPIKAQTMSNLERAIKIIILVWVLACSCAVPYAIYARTFPHSKHPTTKEPLAESLVCNIPKEYWDGMKYMFQVSAFLFFVTPMTVIIVMYILIGITLRRSTQLARAKSESNTTHSRKVVIKMLGRKRSDKREIIRSSSQSGSGPSATRRKETATLHLYLVAVVVAFFLCFAPHHVQRLLTLYVKDWTPTLYAVHEYLYYISGVLYFVSSTINPVLYNLMSKKYRLAFRNLWVCCIGNRTNKQQTILNTSNTSRIPMTSFRRSTYYSDSPKSSPKRSIGYEPVYSSKPGFKNTRRLTKQESDVSGRTTYSSLNGSATDDDITVTEHQNGHHPARPIRLSRGESINFVHPYRYSVASGGSGFRYGNSVDSSLSNPLLCNGNNNGKDCGTPI